jgi:hypothetical protein
MPAAIWAGPLKRWREIILRRLGMRVGLDKVEEEEKEGAYV